MGKITIFFVNLKMTFAKISVSWSSTTWSTGFWNGMLSQANGACVSCPQHSPLLYIYALADPRQISKLMPWHLWMRNVGSSSGLITYKHWETLSSGCWKKEALHQMYGKSTVSYYYGLWKCSFYHSTRKLQITWPKHARTFQNCLCSQLRFWQS